ncbi:MAG: sodium/solute symporter [Candidatus Sumerlaeota bacterium]|nr:sodium/solute symporter [Candidatus Sumerlaeota bacterium]
MNGLALLDVLVILAYFVGVILLGIWVSRRRIGGGQDLFFARREMTWPLVGSSIFAMNISSKQFVGQAGLAFAIGISVGGFHMIGAVCNALMAIVFVDVYQGLRIATQPEFFERRYGLAPRLLVSAAAVAIGVTTELTGVFYTGAQVLVRALAWEGAGRLYLALLVLGLTTGAYTLLGGLRAAMFTDFAQNIVLILGGLVMVIFGIRAAGGLSQLLYLHDAAGRSMWSMVQPWHAELGWLPFVTGVLVLGVYGHCCGPGVVQIVLSAKNAYHAKMGMLLAAALKILGVVIIIVPGVIAARLFPTEEVIDQVYVRLLMEAMPVGILGLCLAGLIASIMSTVSTGLVWSSSLVVYDFVKRFRPGLTEKGALWLGRALMLAVLLFSMALAPTVERAGGLFRYVMQILSLFNPPIVVCVLFGIFWRRANAKGVMATLLGGCVLGSLAYFMLNIVPDPSLLKPEDISRPQAFAAALLKPGAPLGPEIHEALGATGRQALEALAGSEASDASDGETADRLRSLAQSINQRALTQGVILGDGTPLQGVSLRDETKQLLAERPLGLWRTRLNRLLLEDAFPGLVRHSAIEGSRQRFKMSLPVYLQNTYNVGFTLTLINAAILVLVSLVTSSGEEDRAKAEAIVKARSSGEMTRRETRIYRLALVALAVLWIAAVVVFSPWGLG